MFFKRHDLVGCRHFNESDLWIGLHLSTTGLMVHDCAVATADACQAYRNLWSLWADDTVVGYTNWAAQEPNTDECVRMSANGWADYSCDFEFKYICERGILLFKSRCFKRSAAILVNNYLHSQQYGSLAPAKILGHFVRDQHMTSSFSNSKGRECYLCPHLPRASGHGYHPFMAWSSSVCPARVYV